MAVALAPHPCPNQNFPFGSYPLGLQMRFHLEKGFVTLKKRRRGWAGAGKTRPCSLRFIFCSGVDPLTDTC